MSLQRTVTTTPSFTVRIVKKYPHDLTVFTQGILFTPNGEHYYESTGLYGKSEVREVVLKTGAVVKRRSLPTTHFGEGLTVLPSGQLAQLTWRERVIHLYPVDFTKGITTTIPWLREGWGMTMCQGQIVISDGSSFLYFLQASTPYQVRKILTVRAWVKGRLQAVGRLNELEMVERELYANIWGERRIAVIDPVTGIVLRWLDLSSLPVVEGKDAVLNGIAYHSASKRLVVTGKYWPFLYEITV